MFLISFYTAQLLTESIVAFSFPPPLPHQTSTLSTRWMSSSPSSRLPMAYLLLPLVALFRPRSRAPTTLRLRPFLHLSWLSSIRMLPATQQRPTLLLPSLDLARLMLPSLDLARLMLPRSKLITAR